MDRRFEARKQELLDDCQVSPELFKGAMNRLEVFAQPFVDCLVRSEQVAHANRYFQGLLSDLKRKNSESIAYRHDEDRMGLQLFVGKSPWDHRLLLNVLARQVGNELGEPDGVISLDPSAFPKKGTGSVGVQRQWCGRLGKIENCQVGVFMGYGPTVSICRSPGCQQFPVRSRWLLWWQTFVSGGQESSLMAKNECRTKA